MRRHVLRFFAPGHRGAWSLVVVAGGGYARVVVGRSLPVMDGS